MSFRKRVYNHFSKQIPQFTISIQPHRSVVATFPINQYHIGDKRPVRVDRTRHGTCYVLSICQLSQIQADLFKSATVIQPFYRVWYNTGVNQLDQITLIYCWNSIGDRCHFVASYFQYLNNFTSKFPSEFAKNLSDLGGRKYFKIMNVKKPDKNRSTEWPGFMARILLCSFECYLITCVLADHEIEIQTSPETQ